MKSDVAPERAIALDAAVLAAQVASILHNQGGRTVVVTDSKFWTHVTTRIWPAAVQLLQQGVTAKVQDAGGIGESSTQTTIDTTDLLSLTIASSELVLVSLNMTDGNPSVPRQGLQELHAVLFKQNDQTGEPSRRAWLQERRQLYLGGSSEARERWKYIYFTEQDSPVQVRSSMLGQLRQAMDDGLLLLPHRWQPVPHESDIVGKAPDSVDLPQTNYVPAVGNWTTVTSVELKYYKCCDLGMDSERAVLDYEKCGNFWYQCGFFKPPIEDGQDASAIMAQRLKRMEQYKMIRLMQGTQISLLASSEHARQCQPVPLDQECV